MIESLWLKDKNAEKEQGLATSEYASIATKVLNMSGSRIGY